MSLELTEDQLAHLEREGITREEGCCGWCQKQGQVWRLAMPGWADELICAVCALEQLRWRLEDS